PGLRTARFPGASPTYVARTLHPDSIVSPGEAEITYLSGGKFGLVRREANVTDVSARENLEPATTPPVETVRPDIETARPDTETARPDIETARLSWT
ncbi:MAG: hypothetical protein M1134_04980, partial [Actinobacteria bacterium]|nr:hypothetical protein [Actinomycetota bacterium]